MPTAVPPPADAPDASGTPVGLEPDDCYRVVASRDRRFDGVFWTAVSSTGIYCRPSCPARTPARRNVTFHASAAAAQRAGYRACKRCLPDAVPGSPAWDLHADLAGRAMRLIGDGLVDREGVDGLAEALGYSPRHVVRVLTTELGAGPLALARARRAQTARALLEGSDLPVTDIAFAAGFASLRQFNATMREVYAASPRDLRGRAGSTAPAGALDLRVAVRAPYAAGAMLAFLAEHVVAGIETVVGTVYARSLALPHGPAVLAVDLGRVEGAADAGVRQVPVTAWLTDLRDTGTLVERVRRLLDADADPVVLDAQLGADALLGPLVVATPGLRVPGAVDGGEVALRAVIGQQVSLAGARTVTGRLVARHGLELPAGLAGVVPGLTHLFPTAAALADVDPETLPMPRARGRALTGLAAALASGAVRLDRGWAREDVRSALLALPGIGPWTADYVGLRALGHPDVFLPTDVGVRRALVPLGATVDELPALEARWRPWRSYALLHLWNTLMPALPGTHLEEDS